MKRLTKHSLHIVLVVFVNIFSVQSSAQERKTQRPVPEEQDTRSARLWLARACVGESGWHTHDRNLDDCRATFYVYARRWHTVSRRRNITFEQMVRAYSAPLRPTLRHPNRRQRMIRSLPDGDLTGGLARYNDIWSEIRILVHDWFNGRVEDPCDGQAIHFGSATDHASRHWTRINCGPYVHNRFYAMR